MLSCAGQLFKSTDSASSWFAIGDSLINSQSIPELVVSPLNSQFIYAGTGTGVYKSEDGGDTWTEMNEGLTNLHINRLVVDPSHPNVLYAGTNAGLFRYDTPLTAVDGRREDKLGKPALPGQFEPAQNYPNPFNSETVITFTLLHATHVTLEICNLLGQKVKTLAEGAKQAGSHSVVWNGTDQSGKEVPSGIYLYRLRAKNFVQMQKMLLIR